MFVSERALLGHSVATRNVAVLVFPQFISKRKWLVNFFSTIFRPFPCSNNVQVLGTVQSPRAVRG